MSASAKSGPDEYTSRSRDPGRSANDRVVIPERLWHDLFDELAQRAGGVREAGAFLLAPAPDSRHVCDVAYYDDLDPNSLAGGITFAGTGYSRLWARCRAEGLRVVADVHTHYTDGVRQSGIDRANPMISQVGHVAIIVPYLAAKTRALTSVGAHQYRGDQAWSSHFGPDVAQVLILEPDAVQPRPHDELPAQSAGLASAAHRRAKSVWNRMWSGHPRIDSRADHPRPQSRDGGRRQ